MSVLGHAAVGLVAGRATSVRDEPPERLVARMLVFAGLAVLPDVDLVLQAIAPHVGLFAHRGPSHSIAVALLVGMIGAAVASNRRRLRIGAAVTAVVASHGLLDALGTSSVGVELLWPLTDTRWLAPWHVLPNFDIARPWPSIVGVVLVELIVFAPAWLYALLPRRGPRRLGPGRSGRSSYRG